MMRAAGLPRSGLFTMVLLEGAAIGLLGIVLALGMGIALGSSCLVQFPALLGWRLQLHFLFEFLSERPSTLLLCIFASLLPSLRAGRLVSVPRHYAPSTIAVGPIGPTTAWTSACDERAAR